MNNYKKNAFLIIGVSLGNSLPQFITECHKKGLVVVLISRNRYSVDMDNYDDFKRLYEERVELADVLYEETTLSDEIILKIIGDISKSYDIEAIYASTEEYVEICSKISSIYNLENPGIKASAISRNKILQRMVMEKNYINTPKYIITDSLDEAIVFLEEYGQVVMKPYNLSASNGVKKITRKEEMKEYLNENPKRRFLIEQYICGREVSVECIVQSGRVLLNNITNKGKGDEPFFVETMQMVPAKLNAKIEYELKELGKRIIDITNMQTGILHLEVIIERGSQKLFPVEFAVREPGHNIMDLINWHYGGAALGLLIDVMRGKNMPDLKETTEKIAVTAYVDFPEGEIIDIFKKCDLLTINGVKEFDFFGRVGDKVKSSKSNYDPIDSLIICADNKQQMFEILDKIDASFYLTIKTASGVVKATLTEQIRTNLQEY